MSCSTALSWGAALSSRATGGVAGWTTCGPASALIWRAIRTIAICFGPVSISGGLPPAARDLLVAFYRLWFPATHPLAESRRPYPASLPDVLAQFGGEDYNDDLARLKSLLGNLGCAIPPLYKQYSEVCEPGGVQFIDFGSDPDFNNCVDGLVLVDLTYLKANRYQRYIGAHLGAQKSA